MRLTVDIRRARTDVALDALAPITPVLLTAPQAPGAATHVYSQVGSRTVTLSATNLDGTAMIASATPVRALPPRLVAAYRYEEASGPDVADLSGKGALG